MRKLLCSLASLTIGCMLVGNASAAGSAIADRADFFSQRAERQATTLLEELQQKHGVEVRVETFASPPDDQAERVKSMSSRERGQYFQDLLKRLARERQAHGIFILICREPSHLRMGVSKELHQRGFTDSDRDAAVNAMMAAFKDKDYDRGLMSALESIRDRTQRGLRVAGAPGTANGKLRTPGAPAGAPASGRADSPLVWMGGWICMGLGALMIGFLLYSIVKSLFGQRGGMTPAGAGGPYSGQGGYSPGGYGSGGYGGGGMFGGMLSGLGGALLGNWIYDQWGGRSAHAGYPDSGHSSGPMNVPPSDNYDDFSSGGGDFGDSGGGDFGGGDFGGGDFGGGDMGGGGGDGGGDF